MKHAVITGAADGIGRALAARLALAGYTLTGLDRDIGRAAQTQTNFEAQGYQLEFILTDLGVPAELSQALKILSRKQPVDLLVHNAGINAVGRFATLSLAEQRRVLDINLVAPLLITAHLLQEQRLKSGGSLIFVASLSHFVGYPGAAMYAATKDGLNSYARSLSVSLAAQNIHVLTVYPGPTRTAHARRYSPDNRRESSRMAPDALADQIYAAMEARRARLIPGMGNKLFAQVGKYLPRLADWAMQKAILNKLP